MTFVIFDNKVEPKAVKMQWSLCLYSQCRLKMFRSVAIGADRGGQTRGFCPQEKAVRVSGVAGRGQLPSCSWCVCCSDGWYRGDMNLASSNGEKNVVWIFPKILLLRKKTDRSSEKPELSPTTQVDDQKVGQNSFLSSWKISYWMSLFYLSIGY